ncbi:unnamed protein product [Moneuplotes crassus]|uniref:FCP1 homology domain-containing protein n=1 Tax=Euplotes crassus TaxID=5936 RepID=A0AAD1Y9I3_EUPCR|nr:unnamed protein product [Moneuplotes crassus]
MVPDSPSERKRDKDQRSHYNDDKRHNGREIKAVSVTPVKSVYSRYPLTYKNEISDSSKQAYKRYNYEPRRSDQSEFTVEDAVSQAPNPSAHPKPSKDFKSSKTPPEYDLPDPVYDRVTGGYLAPQIEENLGKKTLVLDLDETLIHSWFKPINSPDLCLDVKIKNKFTKIYVLTRPWVYNFLDEVQKLFEVVIFTASVSTYAIPIINKLDRTDYQYQMLFRQHCDTKSGSFVKDLSKLGRDLKDCVIIDNTPNCYRLQKRNALPILSWFEDPRDRELDKLLPILKKLAKVEDVRPYIKKLVNSNAINFDKIYRVFRNVNEHDSLKRSFSFRSDKDQRTEISRSKNRPKSTRRRNKDKHSKTKEIETLRGDRSGTTINNEDGQVQSMKSLKKDSDLKSKIKHSFVNINNENKKIYPKKKRIAKYTSSKKLSKEKKINKETSSKLLQKSSERLRREIQQYSSKLKRSIESFDVEDKVHSIHQEETSKLANYAHHLRKSYLRTGKSKKRIT